MFNFFTKLIFQIKKPRLVIVSGQHQETTIKAIDQVLSEHFRVRRCQKKNRPCLPAGRPWSLWGAEVLICPWRDKCSLTLFRFLVEKSRSPVLVITDKDLQGVGVLAKALPANGHLLLNFDDETVREISELTNLHTSTFGFQEGADFRASDVREDGGTNFKVSYQGSIVPFWLEKVFGKEDIYAALSAAAVGLLFDLNLVQVSQALKNYRG